MASANVGTVCADWAETVIRFNAQPALCSTIISNNGISVADQFTSVDVTSLVQAWLANNPANLGLNLRPNGSGSVVFDSKESGGNAPTLVVEIARITSVSGTNGLTGTGTSGDISLGIIDGGVTTLKLANGAVTSPKIANGAVGNAQLGINYAGSSSQGGSATSALIANDAQKLGGIDPSGYAPAAASPNYVSVTGAQTITGAKTFTSAQAFTGGMAIGQHGATPDQLLNVGGNTGVVAGVFTNNHNTSTNDALFALHTGRGNAFRALNTQVNGRAGFFENSHPSTTGPTLETLSRGAGPALRANNVGGGIAGIFDGGVTVNGGLTLSGSFDSTHLKTPGTLNDSGNPIDWTKLKNVPSSLSSGQLVNSLNGLSGGISLAAGNNISITPTGNTLTIASTFSGSNFVDLSTNQTVNGSKTFSNPISTIAHYSIGGNRVLSTAGTNNVMAGVGAGSNNTAADGSFFGFGAGEGNTTGIRNAFFGSNVGRVNINGGDNGFFGAYAGASNTSGSNNAFFGAFSGEQNTTGEYNNFVGSNAGKSNTTGSKNAFFGALSGANNTTASSNAFFGYVSGRHTSGGDNAFFGGSAGEANTSGVNNSFFGSSAGLSNTTESYNTFIGAFSNGAPGVTNSTAIGAGATVNTSNTMVLGTNAVTVQAPGSLKVFGDLTVTGSSSLTLANGSVSTANLADASITNAKIAAGGIGTQALADNSVLSNKIANGQVVKSLNGLTDNINLVAGGNITLTPSGNSLTITGTSNDSSVVHLAGAETITGSKTFTSAQNFTGGMGIGQHGASSNQLLNVGGNTGAVAGLFTNNHNTSTNDALFALHTGRGTAFRALNTQVNGRAGFFESSHPNSNGPALEATTPSLGAAFRASNTGTGLAGLFDGGVRINGNLTVTGSSNLTVADGTVTTAKLADASVTAQKLASGPAPQAGQVLGYNGGNLIWQTPKSSLRLVDNTGLEIGFYHTQNFNQKIIFQLAPTGRFAYASFSPNGFSDVSNDLLFYYTSSNCSGTAYLIADISGSSGIYRGDDRFTDSVLISNGLVYYPTGNVFEPNVLSYKSQSDNICQVYSGGFFSGTPFSTVPVSSLGFTAPFRLTK